MIIEEKKQRIQPKHHKLSIQKQRELIGLSRSSYYRESLLEQKNPENLEMIRLIDNEYTRHPFYGRWQMRNSMRRNGYKINRKRVQRLMRKMLSNCAGPLKNTLIFIITSGLTKALRHRRLLKFILERTN